jgi:hypothetical protein
MRLPDPLRAIRSSVRCWGQVKIWPCCARGVRVTPLGGLEYVERTVPRSDSAWSCGVRMNHHGRKHNFAITQPCRKDTKR